MDIREKFVIEEIMISEGCSALIASYRPDSRAGFSIDQIVRRYSWVVEDGERVKEKFSPGQLYWIKSTIINWSSYAEATDRLYYQVNTDVETYLELYEGDPSALPDAWEEMLAKLRSLSIGEELGLVEWIERQISLEKVSLSWPSGKIQGVFVAAS